MYIVYSNILLMYYYKYIYIYIYIVLLLPQYYFITTMILLLQYYFFTTMILLLQYYFITTIILRYNIYQHIFSTHFPGKKGATSLHPALLAPSSLQPPSPRRFTRNWSSYIILTVLYLVYVNAGVKGVYIYIIIYISNIHIYNT